MKSWTERELRERLAVWAARGLITAEQADRIEAAELAGVASAAPSGKASTRAQIVVEALGYLGGILTITGVFVVLHDLWPTVPTWVELALSGAAAVALGMAGAALQVDGRGGIARLRAVLWLLSSASLAGFAYLLAEHVLHLSDDGAGIIASAVGTVYSAVLWRVTGHAVQEVGTFVAAALLVTTAIFQAVPSGSFSVWPAVGLLLLSLAWGTAVHRGWLMPRRTGYALAGAGMLAGAEFFTSSGTTAGDVMALATAAALFAAGLWIQRMLLVVLGAIGIVVHLPGAAGRLLPSAAATPLSFVLAGLLLVSTALWLARRRRVGVASRDPGE